MDTAGSHHVGSHGPRRRGPAHRGASLALCGLPVALALACGLGGGEGVDSASRELRELEGLAFLPSAELVLTPGGGVARLFVVDPPILIDRFEVTRAQWAAFLREQGLEPDPVLAEHMATWRPGTDNWPATMMTRSEAQAFAAARGMRLPTIDEWLLAAVGTNLWAYPWGTTFRDSVANTLEFGLGHPTPVGTFESGRTPSSCYDLLGNVCEWVDGPVPRLVPTEEPDSVQEGREVTGALGGSFRTWSAQAGRTLFGKGPNQEMVFELHPEGRADHVGLRCVVDAREYLWEHADAWGDDEDARSRVAAVGERFGRQALPLLTELAARPGAPRSLALLVKGARR